MNILLVFAHPDDEVLGCGATAARFTMQGASISTLILSDGVASRYNAIGGGGVIIYIRK